MNTSINDVSTAAASELALLLGDSVMRLFRDSGNAAARAEREGWLAELWTQIADLGLPLTLVPEAHGGVGGGWEAAYAVLHPAGYYAIPLPVGESLLAARLCSGAGMALPEGPTSVATNAVGSLQRTSDGYRYSGSLKQVPWGRHVTEIVTAALLDGVTHVVAVPREACTIEERCNFAAEPRDTLHCSQARVRAAPSDAIEARQLFDYCALLRTVQISGALEAALQRSIEYARERKQFGRAIGQFQAVQQQLAVFGAEAAAVDCAVRAACRAADSTEAGFQIAAAKLRANQAIGIGTATAHQVHAAIGFTWEHALRHSTQRLMSWRSEYGNDRTWSSRLGALIAARGADHFWSDLTAREDLASVGASA